MKNIKIEYSCDRCEKTITETKKVNGPIQWTGLWPKGYKRLHQRHVCETCYKEFYERTLPEFFNSPLEDKKHANKKTVKDIVGDARATY
jgi:hypothetical protein